MKAILSEWANENGWSELRYAEEDGVWRGFRGNSLSEEDVPTEVLLKLAPIEYGGAVIGLDFRLKHLKFHLTQLYSKQGIYASENLQTNNETAKECRELFDALIATEELYRQSLRSLAEYFISC